MLGSLGCFLISKMLISSLQRFKGEDLLPQEEMVNNLLDDGDRMIELKHPASSCIQVSH